MPATVTTWGIVVEIEEGGTASALFEAARRAYFAGCPRLAEVLRAEEAEIAIEDERIEPADSAWPGMVIVAASVVEVRGSSFDMTVRIRGEGGDETADGRCTVTLVRSGSREVVPVPRPVRDEFIAIQLGSRAYL